MIGLNKITDVTKCTGCSACYSICPVECIKMVTDQLGFLYPEIDSKKCIDCGKCRRICPQNVPVKGNVNGSQNAYAAISKDYHIWKRSSSGGAFSEICRAWGDNKTIIIGAAWNGLKVEHICVEGIDNITPLCKSKYVSSDMNDIFKLIKEYLEEEKKVIFCGTPCQVAGLKAYLGKKDDKLLLIDLICHGVGSPKVFSESIRILEEQFKITILKYGFREKKRFYNQDHISKIQDNRGRSLLIENDPFIQLFTSQRCLRMSCGKNCNFRNSDRQGDITIGDFKYFARVYPEKTGEKRNYSVIIFNNQFGKNILNNLKKSMIMYPCSISDVKQYNPIFHRHTWFAEDREEFVSDFQHDSRKAIQKWTTSAKKYKRSIKRMVLDYLPVKIRKIILVKRNNYEKK